MKRVSGIFSMLLMFYTTNIYSTITFAQNLRLSGFVTDINSHQPIDGVALYAVVDNHKKLVTNSIHEGRFTLEYPNSGTSLILEKQGYRSLTIAVADTIYEANPKPFFVQIPLVPLDQQVSDRPYMQSEQKEFVLNTQDVGKQKVTRLFKIKDALTNQYISSATICFEYTKIVKKECRDITPEMPAQSMSFMDADIINMVVESAGYQTYRGNLILDKMDGSNSVYEMKLAPDVTIFTIQLKNISVPAVCSLTPISGDNLVMSSGPSNSFYALGRTGDFLLKINTSSGELLHSEKVTIDKGLNYKIITVKKKASVPKLKTEISPEPKITVKKNTVPLADSVKNIILYFTQSEHKLLPEAKEKLDQLALWLQTIPDRKIKIDGHSDNVGDPRKNEVLSEYRARVTYNYLLQQGIAREKMQCTWLGGKRPVDKNDSEETKKKNRRVEITLIPEKK